MEGLHSGGHDLAGLTEPPKNTDRQLLPRAGQGLLLQGHEVHEGVTCRGAMLGASECMGHRGQGYGAGGREDAGQQGSTVARVSQLTSSVIEPIDRLSPWDRHLLLIFCELQAWGAIDLHQL